jgi:hypothetical protein
MRSRLVPLPVDPRGRSIVLSDELLDTIGPRRRLFKSNELRERHVVQIVESGHIV